MTFWQLVEKNCKKTGFLNLYKNVKCIFVNSVCVCADCMQLPVSCLQLSAVLAWNILKQTLSSFTVCRHKQVSMKILLRHINHQTVLLTENDKLDRRRSTKLTVPPSSDAWPLKFITEIVSLESVLYNAFCSWIRTDFYSNFCVVGIIGKIVVRYLVNYPPYYRLQHLLLQASNLLYARIQAEAVKSYCWRSCMKSIPILLWRIRFTVWTCRSGTGDCDVAENLLWHRQDLAQRGHRTIRK